MTPTKVILLTPLDGAEVDYLASELGGHVTVIRTEQQLFELDIAFYDALVCFGSGVIVPNAIIEKLSGRAYNFHGAPPEFPGRDPHHFAAYAGVSEYGATFHLMNAKVDEGPIIAVERFDVDPGCSPATLLSQANTAMLRLFSEWGPKIGRGEELPAHQNIAWGRTKTSRADFLNYCDIRLTINENEFRRREHAFSSSDYKNLRVTMFGTEFREVSDSVVSPVSDLESQWGEFTEAGYKNLLLQAKSLDYDFLDFNASQTNRKGILWRHDIDFSVHRARALAEIEYEQEVRSTWFINPHCSFYNIFEPDIRRRISEILEMGHVLGLHFDAENYGEGIQDRTYLEDVLGEERNLLQALFGRSIDVVSWHNPDIGGLLAITDDIVAGMVNCYSGRLRENYTYVSDSNGYWRFKSIGEVLSEHHERLQVLTHPGWWTPEAMVPRERVERCLMGRARAVAAEYDRAIAVYGRQNIGAPGTISQEYQENRNKRVNQ